MSQSASRAAGFSAIAMGIYVAVAAASDWLCIHNGKDNPFLKVMKATGPQFDWVILGSSHAMPLTFDAIEGEIASGTNRKIINLAALGAGPLYEKYVFENFLEDHQTRGVVYTVDSFAFLSPSWNEERFSDPALLAHTPFRLATLKAYFKATWHDHVPMLAMLDHLSQFSKINNRDRFKPDQWKGETQFDQAMQPSQSANKSRIAYLYPGVAAGEDRQPRSFDDLRQIIQQAKRQNAKVLIVKLPLPQDFRAMLPNEAGFDTLITQLCNDEHVAFADLSGTINDSAFYFDTDHLNRQGVRKLYAQDLTRLLTAPWDSPQAEHR